MTGLNTAVAFPGKDWLKDPIAIQVRLSSRDFLLRD